MSPIAGLSFVRESFPIRSGVDQSDRGKRSPDEARLGPKQLNPKQQEEVKELQARDREVRAHEAAHQAAAGGLGGGATFSYQTGPDGKSYAVGGEVPIDMSSGRTPEETIRRAQQVQAAALAPADPSPQDMAVAAAASQMAAAARQEQLTQASQVSDTALSPPTGSKPSPGESERSVEDRQRQALSGVAADRVSHVRTSGQMQRLASRAIAAYLG